jgi:catechol 2,3-dioxygenase-like lactoylglutathione lyase family enzyme
LKKISIFMRRYSRRALLTSKGVPIDLEPTEQTRGNREMYVKDPDGNSIRFVREGGT